MNGLFFQFITFISFISVSKRQTQPGVDLGPVGSIGDSSIVLFHFRQFGVVPFSSGKDEEWLHGLSQFFCLPFLWLCGLGGQVPNPYTVREEYREERLEGLLEQPSGFTWTEGFPTMQRGKIPETSQEKRGALAFPAWETCCSFHRPKNRFLDSRRGSLKARV